MIPTIRGVLLLLLAAPLLAASTWAPALGWIAWGYLLLGLALMALDWRLSGSVHRFQVTRYHDTKLSLSLIHISEPTRPY